MSNTMIIGACFVLVLGILLFFKSNKKRDEKGEWSAQLQWGYLLILIGAFGLHRGFIAFCLHYWSKLV